MKKYKSSKEANTPEPHHQLCQYDTHHHQEQHDASVASMMMGASMVVESTIDRRRESCGVLASLFLLLVDLRSVYHVSSSY